MKNEKILKFYFLIVFLELLGELLLHFTKTHSLIYAFKPLLMPALIYWYLKSDEKALKIMVIALFFSFLGDIFMMLLSVNSLFFMAGLGSFLITHILYLVVFISKTHSKQKSIFWRRPHLMLPFILYGLSLYAYLRQQNNPKFIEMQIPVIVYASIIILMVIFAIGRFNKVNQKSFTWVLIGALLFLFSDTFVALNNFSNIFNGNHYIANIFTMILYTVGQFLIVKGILAQKKGNEY